MGERIEGTAVLDPATLAVPDRMTVVEVNRVRLRCWDWGDPNDPPVLCVHGAHDHGRMWDGIAPRVAELGFHVRAVDLRGHGGSDWHGSGHAWMSMTLDIALLAASHGRRVGLLGHSMGGGQSFSVASNFPELVAWVVNIDGLGPPSEGWGDETLAQATERCFNHIERQLRGARPFPDLDDMVDRRASVNIRLPRPWLEHLVRHGHRVVQGGWAFATDPMFNTGVPDDFTPAMAISGYADVVAPTLVLTGAEHDTWGDLPDDEVAARVAMVRDSRHVVVPDAGHYVHIEQPDQTTTAISDFLAEIDARSLATDTRMRSDTAVVIETTAAPAEHQPIPARPPATRSSRPSSSRALGAERARGPALLALHSLGDDAGGSPWRSAAAAWPGSIDAPDLPGHNGTPHLEGGAVEPADAVFGIVDSVDAVDVVLGVGSSGWSALLYALAGRARSVVIVDGLGRAADDAERLVHDPWIRKVFADPGATSPVISGADPRLAHLPRWLFRRELLEVALAELDDMAVPVLVVESAASDTPLDRAASVAGDRLRRVDAATPELVLDVVSRWVVDDS